ncbi:hypothetical protein IGB42_02955 [Andreprevotia sp. IGB-42]|uniref:nuclear transport factor 2 family protein n=1 Tax=Andreprevotia sp. IGB-42 TaxID=2497473 RepID=UPI00135A8010|nr:nuclear transport factor 2 family protein [Andreprevotia sp. IGB-42]KAF0812663.1 hypothetical protein IGB42_02955 [Andreprevotia sp. IGB-42]
MQRNRKDIASSFLQLVAAGSVREAFGEYIAGNFRHHNPSCAGDAHALMLAMEENASAMPQKTLQIQRALVEGDLVAIHSHMVPAPGERGVALMHLFRFERDLIVELWDIGQPVPAQSVNQYGMF